VTLTQHAHIYRFPTSNFNFGQFFLIFFIHAAPTTVASGHKNQLQPDARLCETSTRPWETLVSREVSSRKVGLARTCETLVSREVSSRKVGLARSLVLAKTP
jgi:hypothetical protein